MFYEWSVLQLHEFQQTESSMQNKYAPRYVSDVSVCRIQDLGIRPYGWGARCIQYIESDVQIQTSSNPSTKAHSIIKEQKRS